MCPAKLSQDAPPGWAASSTSFSPAEQCVRACIVHCPWGDVGGRGVFEEPVPASEADVRREFPEAPRCREWLSILYTNYVCVDLDVRFSDTVRGGDDFSYLRRRLSRSPYAPACS